MKPLHYHHNGQTRSWCGRAYAGPRTVTGQMERVTCRYCLAELGVVNDRRAPHPEHVKREQDERPARIRKAKRKLEARYGK